METSANSRPLLVTGLTAVLSGGVVLTRLTWWYGSDMGWDGSGSSLRSGTGPLLLVGAAVAVLVLGAVALVAGRRQASAHRTIFAAVVGLAAAALPLTLTTYPRIGSAVLASVQEPEWQARLPLTEVLGVRSQSGDHLVIEGKLDRRHCEFELRAVSLDVATGEVTDVGPLPTTYADISLVPPPPSPLDPARFRVLQGSSPYICSS